MALRFYEIQTNYKSLREQGNLFRQMYDFQHVCFMSSAFSVYLFVRFVAIDNHVICHGVVENIVHICNWTMFILYFCYYFAFILLI